jgi:hypothetical protein
MTTLLRLHAWLLVAGLALNLGVTEILLPEAGAAR